MTQTTRVAVPADAWTEIADGNENVMVQLLTIGTLFVDVGSVASELAVDGHEIKSAPGMTSISFSSLGSGDKVFVRPDGSHGFLIVVTK